MGYLHSADLMKAKVDVVAISLAAGHHARLFLDQLFTRLEAGLWSL